MMPVCLFPNISREWLQGRNLTTVSLFFALERASCGGCCQHEGVRSRYALDTAGLNTQCTDLHSVAMRVVSCVKSLGRRQ